MQWHSIQHFYVLKPFAFVGDCNKMFRKEKATALLGPTFGAVLLPIVALLK